MINKWKVNKMSGKILIALNSYIAGGGKDTVADYLVENHGFKKYSLSKGVYEIAYDTFDVPRDTKPPRPMLHHIGESLRDYDVILWIKKVLKEIEDDGHDRVVITDVRKGLEHFYLKESGYLNLLVYCDIEIALERIRKRDSVHLDEDAINLLQNSRLESEVRSLPMDKVDNSGDFEKVAKRLDTLVKIYQNKLNKSIETE